MEWELVPRVAALAGKVVLAAELAALLVRWRGRMAAPLRHAWLIFAVFYVRTTVPA